MYKNKEYTTYNIDGLYWEGYTSPGYYEEHFIFNR